MYSVWMGKIIIRTPAKAHPDSLGKVQICAEVRGTTCQAGLLRFKRRSIGACPRRAADSSQMHTWTSEMYVQSPITSSLSQIAPCQKLSDAVRLR